MYCILSNKNIRVKCDNSRYLRRRLYNIYLLSNDIHVGTPHLWIAKKTKNVDVLEVRRYTLQHSIHFLFCVDITLVGIYKIAQAWYPRTSCYLCSPRHVSIVYLFLNTKNSYKKKLYLRIIHRYYTQPCLIKYDLKVKLAGQRTTI